MDIFAHVAWTYIIFHNSPELFLALFFGIFPDLASFTIYGAHIIFSKKNFIRHLRNLEHEARSTPKWVLDLYNISHSLITSTIIFIALSIAAGKVLWFITPWILHILIDVPLHRKDAYPTPFLWPLSKYKFDGISWGSLDFMIFNYILIAIFFLLIFLGVLD